MRVRYYNALVGQLFHSISCKKALTLDFLEFLLRNSKVCGKTSFVMKLYISITVVLSFGN